MANLEFHVEKFKSDEIPIIKLKAMNFLLDEYLLKYKDGYNIQSILYWLSFIHFLYIFHLELILNYSDEFFSNLLTEHFQIIIRICSSMLKDIEVRDEEIESETMIFLRNRLENMIYLFGNTDIRVSSIMLITESQ